MSIEGNDTLRNPVTDSFGRLLPMQDTFVKEHLFALRLEEQEEGEGYHISWDDTGESILQLLEMNMIRTLYRTIRSGRSCRKIIGIATASQVGRHHERKRL